MKLVLLPLLALIAGQGQTPPAAKAPIAVPVPVQPQRKTYNETADARLQIAAAVRAAAEDDIRVLVTWGANEDERCTKFVQVQRAPELAEGRFFSDEYKVVNVDVGHLDKNLDVAQAYGAKPEAGALPYLTILDKAGKVLAGASSRQFAAESDPATPDAKKVAAFLSKYKAQPPELQPLFDAVLAQAGRDNRYVFLWFSAPW